MRAPSLTRSAAIENPTHIYILGFSDGVVKVGRTSNPRQRIRYHAAQAAKRWCLPRARVGTADGNR